MRVVEATVRVFVKRHSRDRRWDWAILRQRGCVKHIITTRRHMHVQDRCLGVGL